MTRHGIDIPREELAAFCRRWCVRELSLFGSALRDDFGPGSDLDFLVSFQADAEWDLFDWVDMKAELEASLGRSVDLVAKEAIRNPWRRREVLSTRQVLYAS